MTDLDPGDPLDLAELDAFRDDAKVFVSAAEVIGALRAIAKAAHDEKAPTTAKVADDAIAALRARVRDHVAANVTTDPES